MTKAEVKYTTADGVEHVEIIELNMYPILSLETLCIDGVPIPLENIRFTEEA